MSINEYVISEYVINEYEARKCRNGKYNRASQQLLDKNVLLRILTVLEVSDSF